MHFSVTMGKQSCHRTWMTQFPIFIMRSTLFTPSARFLSFIAIAGPLLVLSGVPAPALAQKTDYTDVPAGAYYEDSAAALLSIGALDTNETRFRPSDLATRAELVKLLVNLRSESLVYPARSSFSDVSLSAWYSAYFEAAANAGWIHGDGNCYQNFRPCTARPADPLNRAEAAALLMRAFVLEHTGSAPQFPDNMQNTWYYLAMQTAADHCVLQGDGGTGLVRPSSYMNRAEMVVMFDRAYQNLQYGADCGVTSPHISSITPTSSNRVRVVFSQALDASRMEDASRYSVVRVSNSAAITVHSATRVDGRTVDLVLDAGLSADVSYMFTARNLLSQAGTVFTDSARFTFSGVEGQLLDATAVSSTFVRLTFDTNLDAGRARDESRYTVERIGGGSIGIRHATLVNDHTVDLELTTALAAGTSYRVTGNNLLTSEGVIFSDNTTFTSLPASGHVTGVQAISATRIRVTFDTDLDVTRAQQVSRYTVTGGSHTLSLLSADLLVDRRTVDLSLADTLQTQRAYTVSVNEMVSAGGAIFSDSGIGIYDAGSVALTARLTGMQETPPVATTAMGTGSFVLTLSGLQYDITVQGLSSDITAAHFHLGDSGIGGPAIFSITFVGNHATGTWTGITADQREAILNGVVYVNVHTTLHPDGEIRGQFLTP